MILTIRLPLPPRELAPNGQGASARRWKHHDSKPYTIACSFIAQDAAKAQDWACPAKARVSLTFALKGARAVGLYCPTDWDNAVASYKAAQDGLVVAGVIAGDSWAHLEVGRIAHDDRHGPWLDVVLEGLHAGD